MRQVFYLGTCQVFQLLYNNRLSYQSPSKINVLVLVILLK